MNNQKRWVVIVISLLVAMANGAGLVAQGAQQERTPQKEVVVDQERIVIAAPESEVPLPRVGALAQHGEGDTMIFVSSEISFDNKVVKGAPYSAQSINESVQTLSDGNRIVRKNTASIYRDSEGRTRRDQTLAAVGPWSKSGEPGQMTFINDPVAGVNYIINPNERTARKLTLRRIHGDGEETVVLAGPRGPESRRKMAVEAPMHAEGGVFPRSRSRAEPKKESLGKQTIEGVIAEGTRSTITIPAGEIGNELPINIVSEQWYSPELQTIVMSKHSDPRFGETTYRLTSITRGEPSRSLFEVPSDYRIKEEKGPTIQLRTKKPQEN